MKKSLKIYFAFIVFLFIFLWHPLSPGAKTTGGSKNISANGNEVRIALALPTRGRYAFFGKQFINGLLLSIDKRRGSKIKYIIINLPVHAGGKTIGYMFGSLSKKKISAVIGPIFEGQLKYFSSYSLKYKIPVITPSPVVPQKDFSPFFFSYGMTLKQEIKAEMKYAGYAGINKVSAIYPDSGYGLKILSFISLFAKQYGINVINTTAYSGRTVDFFDNFDSLVKFKGIGNTFVSQAEKSQLGITKYDLMHGITGLRPEIPFDGLFVIGSPSKLELILTQLAYYNITGFPILGLSSLDSRSFIEKYGFYMQNAIFPNGFFKHDDNKIVKKFSSSYKKNYGKMPNILSAEGYDIGGILIKAAENMNNNKGETKFYKAILSVKSYKGVCGISKLTGKRFKKPLYLFKYKNHKIYILRSPF